MSSPEQFSRATVGDATPAQSAPDWATQATDIHCPLCEYNLRGLIEPRCPECGHRFEWQVLLDARQHLHPYLFEHHPERNFRSFFQTVWGALWPSRFWTVLKPVQPVRVRRLLMYWIVCALIRGAPAFAACLANLITDISFLRRLGYPMPSWQDWAAREINYNVAAIIELAWPWVTFLALMVFQISMRRAGIRKTHVLRCVVYSSDIIFWSGLAGIIYSAAAGLSALSVPQTQFDFHELTLNLFSLAIFVWLIMTSRLYVAYKKYLAFDKPLATVVASQMIAALIVLTGFFYSQW